MAAAGRSSESAHSRTARTLAEAAEQLAVERSGPGGHVLTSMDVERFTATAADFRLGADLA